MSDEPLQDIVVYYGAPKAFVRMHEENHCSSLIGCSTVQYSHQYW
jgi:hypothetical protein